MKEILKKIETITARMNELPADCDEWVKLREERRGLIEACELLGFRLHTEGDGTEGVYLSVNRDANVGFADIVREAEKHELNMKKWREAGQPMSSTLYSDAESQRVGLQIASTLLGVRLLNVNEEDLLVWDATVGKEAV